MALSKKAKAAKARAELAKSVARGTKLPHAEKIQRLANVLTAYYGMKQSGKDYTKAKANLKRSLEIYGLTTDHIFEAIPQARDIIRQRTVDFMDNRTVVNAL